MVRNDTHHQCVCALACQYNDTKLHPASPSKRSHTQQRTHNTLVRVQRVSPLSPSPATRRRQHTLLRLFYDVASRIAKHTFAKRTSVHALRGVLCTLVALLVSCNLFDFICLINLFICAKGVSRRRSERSEMRAMRTPNHRTANAFMRFNWFSDDLFWGSVRLTRGTVWIAQIWCMHHSLCVYQCIHISIDFPYATVHEHACALTA